MTKITAAAIQVGSRLFDLEGTIEIFAERLLQAKTAGADIVVFPEAFLGGYPKGIDFGVKVGMRMPEGREQFLAYFNSAIERDSKQIDQVRELVKDSHMNVVVGLIERAGGTLYCVSATIGREGDILAWHRKLMPTAMERVIWGQGDGSTIELASTDVGLVSTAICWENYMPLFRSHLYENGTQIHCVPTVDDRSVWLPSMQTISLEGRCFVISACQFMVMADVKLEWFQPIQGNDPETVLINGGSCIVSPMGEILAEPVFGKEALIVAELDLDDIPRGKFDLDLAGHYSRPDVFQLSVNQNPKKSIV